MKDKGCFFNGVDGETGGWFQEPFSIDEFLEQTKQTVSPAETEEPRGLAYGDLPGSLAETGWGVIFPEHCDPKIVGNLMPLLCHRRAVAGSLVDNRFKILWHSAGLSKTEFLQQQGAPGPGMPINPDRMPYYLLIVGSPEQISFEFQHRLATDYAVGRIYFDHPDDYGVYAQSVADWETRTSLSTKKELALFGVQNQDDPMTALSTRFLMDPLHAELKNLEGWNVQQYSGEATKKEQLARLMGGDQTPSLLFTASHGLCYRANSPFQRKQQGALVCREWPGPKGEKKVIARDAWFGASDIPEDANLHGLISFQMGCFTIGTPRLDALLGPDQSKDRYLASENFISALPQRMLAHRNGGALAIIGSVGRSWEYSFVRDRQEEQSASFKSCLAALADGMPVGFALSFFTSRAPALAEELLNSHLDKGLSNIRRLARWTDYHDARTYAILGDPACRVLGGRP